MKKIFIDGGARIGESIHELLEKRKDLEGCDVHLFECNSDHIDTLIKIREENKKYNFIVHDNAIWVENCELDFYLSIDRWSDLGSTLHSNKKEKLDLLNPRKVKAIDITEFIDSLENNSYIILKLDVEGSEYEIIRKLIDTGSINKIKELFIEWHDGFFNQNSQSLKLELNKFNIKINHNWM